MATFHNRLSDNAYNLLKFFRIYRIIGSKFYNRYLVGHSQVQRRGVFSTALTELIVYDATYSITNYTQYH